MLRLVVPRVTKSSVCLGPSHVSTEVLHPRKPLSQTNQDSWSPSSYGCITPPKLPDTGRQKEMQIRVLEPQTKPDLGGGKGNSGIYTGLV